MSRYAFDRRTAHTLLTLLSLEGLGRKTVRRLLAARPDAHSFSALLESAPAAPSYDTTVIDQAYDYATGVMERSQQDGIRIIGYFDKEFPATLKSIEDPPLLLHIRGDIAALHSWPAIAVIGTREPTKYGEGSAHRIAAAIARSNGIVVSGLALGCDAAAHWGCLEAGGRTVAILAHGLDKVYPVENKELAAEVLSHSGCLVSEYEIGKRPFKTSFVDRDRLQSGMVGAVIVIETGVVGGSMHTVRFARTQGRIVACVKHPTHYMHEHKVQGNTKLLEEGSAIPLNSADDVQELIQRVLSLSPTNPTWGEPPSQEIARSKQSSMF